MRKKNRIAKLRKERGLSQPMLAAKVGLSKSTISKIETGGQRMLGHQALAISDALGVSMNDLYEDGGVVSPARGGFAEEAAPFTPETDTLESRIPLEEHQSWYKIETSYLDQIGYLDGDLVVIDISREALTDLQIGDVVIANYYPRKNGAETIVRQFIPPSLLITNGRKNLPSLNTESDNVSILGKVVYPRRRPARAR